MPSARPSEFQQRGGGFFKGDGKIVGYKVTIGDPTDKLIKGGPSQGEPFTPLGIELAVLFDGATEPTTRNFGIGHAGDFNPLPDGKTIGDHPTKTAQKFWPENEWPRFIASLETAGFPPDRYDADVTEANWEPIIGTRVTLDTEKDPNKQGKRKYVGKDGVTRETDYTRVIVTKVLALPIVANTGKPGNTATAGATLDAMTREVMRKVLAQAGGELSKAKLATALQLELTSKHPYYAYRDAIRKRAVEDEMFLEAIPF
jgi:hypothetical protein